MATEEQELFAAVGGNMKANRSYVLDVLAGEDDSPATEGQSAAGSTRGAAPPAEAEGSSGPTDHSSGTGSPADPVGGQPGSPAGGSEPPADTGVSAADVMGGGDETAESQPTPPADVPPEEPADDTRDTESEMGTPPHEVESATAREGAPKSEYPVRKDGGTGAQAAEGGSQTGINRKTVRVTESVDTFVGADDRDYDLDRNDVVTLPSTNAELLVERDVAERID
jgi:DNA replication factor GINS